MPTTVEFDRNITVDEDAGTVKVKIIRTGDLSQGTTVFYTENWDDSSANKNDLEFSRVTSGTGDRYQSGEGGYVYFAPGDSTVYLEYKITDDTREEDYERLYLELTSAVGADIDDNSAYIRIRPSDEPITIDIQNATVDEGGYFQFRLDTSEPVTEAITVYYSVYSGTEHVSHTSGGAIISAGSDTGTIVIGALEDTDTSNETIRVRIDSVSDSSIVIDDSTATGTINDTTVATLPELSLHDGGFTDEGTVSGSYAKLSFAVGYDVTFTATTYYGTYNEANAGGHGGDYGGFIDKQFTIQAGDTTTVVPVAIFVDSEIEANERFEIKIDAGSVSGATVSDGQTTITIRDITAADDSPEDPVVTDPDPEPISSPVFSFPNMDMSTANSTPQTNGLTEIVGLLGEYQNAASPLEIPIRIVEGSFADQVAASNRLAVEARDANWVFGGNITYEGSLEIKQHLNDAVFFERLQTSFSKYADLLPTTVEVGVNVGVVAFDGEVTQDEFVDQSAALITSTTATAAASIVLGSLFLVGTPTGWTIVAVGAGSLLIGTVSTGHLDESGVTDAVKDLISETLNRISEIDLGFDSTPNTGGIYYGPYVEYDFDESDSSDSNDLEVSNVVISDTAFEPGDVVDITYSVTNHDSDDVDYSVNYFLSDDQVISNDDLEITASESVVTGLASGQSNTLSMAFQTAEDFDPGSYHILAEIQNNTHEEDVIWIKAPVDINIPDTSSDDELAGDVRDIFVRDTYRDEDYLDQRDYGVRDSRDDYTSTRLDERDTYATRDTFYDDESIRTEDSSHWEVVDNTIL